METKIIEACQVERIEEAENQVYRSPEVVFIGKAIDLVQGLNYGKNNDGYTGYYFER